jgi:hypothetical protein
MCVPREYEGSAGGNAHHHPKNASTSLTRALAGLFPSCYGRAALRDSTPRSHVPESCPLRVVLVAGNKWRPEFSGFFNA